MLGPIHEIYHSILSVCIPETLLLVTLKRRTEMSAEILLVFCGLSACFAGI